MSFRIAARLDVKGEKLIKGVQLEGLKVVGSPWEAASKYVTQGVDEIIYSDAVASLYGYNQVGEVIERTASELRVPLCVSGGIRSFSDARLAFERGADKVALNTAAVKQPNLLRDIANVYGSQAVVLSVEAKSISPDWEVYLESGREKTGISVSEWVKRAVDFGVGEILVTSVDNEGTGKGFDIPLIAEVVEHSSRLPVVACGGCGDIKHIIELSKQVRVAGVALAKLLHVNEVNIAQIREQLRQNNVEVREFP